MGRASKRVTMQLVADHAGVSLATASRALSQSDLVSDDLVERVKASAAELGYRINRAARALRRQRADAVGLVISDVENPFFASVARAVEDVAQVRGYAVLLCNTDEDLEKERLYFELMVEERVAGVIVAPSLEDPSPLAAFVSDRLPVVCVDREIAGGGFDAVLADNRAGAMAAIRHLVADGHTRIGVVSGTLAGTPSRQRVEGCRDAAMECGGVVLEERAGELRDAIGLEQTSKLGWGLTTSLLTLAKPPTAIFCANNLLTQGALLGLRAAGRQVPGDVALIGWDDTPLYELVEPPLTVVAQPSAEIGRAAAELLFSRIADPSQPARRQLMEPRLVVRASCALKHANPSP
jgi:DNA-binding LacI/PurR family transcriptional regulator